MSELFNNTDITTLNQFQEVFQEIMNIPDDSLNTDTMELFKNVVNNALPENVRKKTISNTISQCKEEGLTYTQVKNNIAFMKNSFKEYVEELKPSANKRELLNIVVDTINSLMDNVVSEYNAADFIMNIKLEDGAQEPTYAHDTDAAADLYALEETVVKAHSFGNKIRTGVSIALPEHWMAFILPRSSIGAKTPLRLSNSVGLIDSGYRGELGVLFDNISDSDYTIQAGDRVAQLLVMPSYQFKANVVDTLDETERGNGGFGSTGT